MNVKQKIFFIVEFIILFGFTYLLGVLFLIDLIATVIGVIFNGFKYFDLKGFMFSFSATIGFIGMNFSIYSIINNNPITIRKKILLLIMLVMGILTILLALITMPNEMRIFYAVITSASIIFTIHVIWIVFYKLSTLEAESKKTLKCQAR
ncbi:MAG: hypothetical protein HRU38_13370 [Saccharospirillaceae bacterium]|nr:hypothetical protein [Saccharospirillaceae bacterium]